MRVPPPGSSPARRRSVRKFDADDAPVERRRSQQRETRWENRQRLLWRVFAGGDAEQPWHRQVLSGGPPLKPEILLGSTPGRHGGGGGRQQDGSGQGVLQHREDQRGREGVFDCVEHPERGPPHREGGVREAEHGELRHADIDRLCPLFDRVLRRRGPGVHRGPGGGDFHARLGARHGGTSAPAHGHGARDRGGLPRGPSVLSHRQANLRADGTGRGRSHDASGRQGCERRSAGIVAEGVAVSVAVSVAVVARGREHKGHETQSPRSESLNEHHHHEIAGREQVVAIRRPAHAVRHHQQVRSEDGCG
mmetsp:Transcript_13847/g.38934  ORF Transcript_13847/g.38934 Transcript_13847/m.38934 type:complete len:307 (-) Transcript_13847:584-1504(-)